MAQNKETVDFDCLITYNHYLTIIYQRVTIIRTIIYNHYYKLGQSWCLSENVGYIPNEIAI